MSDIISDTEGKTIGLVGSYVQQYKDIEAGKVSTAKNPASFNKPSKLESKPLPKKWEKATEKGILLYYCKRNNCVDYNDLEEKSGQIAAAVNRLYSAGLTPSSAYTKLTEHITQEDLFQEEESNSTSGRELVPEKAKSRRKLNVNLTETNYAYKKGLKHLTAEQLDLCRFIDSKFLVFSSDDYGFFLSILPGKENSFDKLFNFSPKEQLLFEMFTEQLGDEHKAKKLVLMSRLMSEFESPKVVKKIRRKKGKIVKKK